MSQGLSLIGRAVSAFALLFFCASALAAGEAQRVLHLLDYIGVDYPPTVQEGAIADPGEYAEMTEFSQRLEALVDALPAAATRPQLLADARRLQTLIEQRVPGRQVAEHTAAMRQRVIQAYGVATAPHRIPDARVGQALFRNQCAGCHGADGRGGGPAAARLAPAPTDFHDRERAWERSLYGLYSAVTLGVEDTAMRAFPELSARERWALAFYVGSLAFEDGERRRGETLWRAGHAPIRDLEVLTRLTPAQAEAHWGAQGVANLAYLRRNPQAITDRAPAPLDVARQRLEASVQAYKQGRPAAAYAHAVAAYLDGFELAESGVRAAAPELVAEVEDQMLAYRKAVRSGAPGAEIERRWNALVDLLGRAERAVANNRLSPSAGFLGAFAILLREGLEAILILAAVGAVLVRSGRRDALPWLHAGWLGALALGVATWGVSAYLIEISGAGRELTEGVTALLAAAVLLYVGFWLHGKTHTQRWQQFVQDRIQRALHGRGLWVLTLIAFLAVYREVFETVLFYQALWLQAGAETGTALWSGIGAAAVALVGLSWVILRSSLRLPLRWFFSVNAAIMLVLAIAFAGHGIAGLQEAGWLPADPVQFPRFDLLGIYPTVETLAAQLALVVLITAAILLERRRRLPRP